MDPADALFEEELYDLSYTLICYYREWKRALNTDVRKAALRLARQFPSMLAPSMLASSLPPSMLAS